MAAIHRDAGRVDNHLEDALRHQRGGERAGVQVGIGFGRAGGLDQGPEGLGGHALGEGALSRRRRSR